MPSNACFQRQESGSCKHSFRFAWYSLDPSFKAGRLFLEKESGIDFQSPGNLKQGADRRGDFPGLDFLQVIDGKTRLIGNVVQGDTLFDADFLDFLSDDGGG